MTDKVAIESRQELCGAAFTAGLCQCENPQ